MQNLAHSASFHSKEKIAPSKHGIKHLGQRFYIDVTVGADLSYAEKEDETEGTVNWADLVDVVTKAFTNRRFKLIEAAAAAIVQAIFDHFPEARHTTVEVRKPSAPIEAIFAFSAIVVSRERTA